MTGIIVTIPPAVEVPPGNNANNPSSLPGVTYLYALLNIPQTWTAKQTFPIGNIAINVADITGLSSSATIDTTNATNITSGTLDAARLPVTAALTGGTLAQFAATTSAQLAGVITDETGTGALVFANAPTLIAPVLGVATATTVNKVTFTQPASAATLTIPDGVTLTGPAVSGTAMTLGNAETVTGVKTFGSAGSVGKLKIAGTTSGSIVLDATAVAGSNTLTLPAETATLITAATTKTLINTTFDTVGTGNSFLIGGTAVSKGQLPGEVSNGSATAGNIGEVFSSTILIGSAVALTTTAPANIATITLTTGDWDLEAMICFTGNSTTTVSGLRGSLSTTSATENTAAPNFASSSYGSATVFATFNVSFAIARIRVSLSGSQQYWLVGRGDFGTSTCSGFGTIRARRAR